MTSSIQSEARRIATPVDTELSMGWVDPWVGLGWVEIFQFLVGSVGSTTAKVLKIRKDYFNAFKALLDEIWLHQAVKFDFMGRSDRYRKLIRKSNKVIMLVMTVSIGLGPNFFHL